MRTDIIIPASGNCVYRASSLAYVSSLWSSLGYEPLVGSIDGPWSKARAVNEALKRSTADVIVVHDGDSWSAATIEAIAAVESGIDWAVPFREVRRLTPEGTEAVLGGHPFHSAKVMKKHRMVPGGGITVLQREVYDEIPLDERFVGWGYEDEAWGIALNCIASRPHIVGMNLYHLWHPPADKRTESKKNSLYWRNCYMKARRKPDAMRALLAEARISE